MALAEFIVMFREALEISLIIGIILAYLHKTGQSKHERHIFVGAGAAVVASVAFAWLFQALSGGFAAYEALFEGIVFIVGAMLVTWMVLWMAHQQHFAQQIQRKVQQEVTAGRARGLMAFAFVAVFREGVEIVIFLGSINAATGQLSLLGAMAGIVAAVLLGYLLFETAVRINLKRFFQITTLLLVFFAAGMFSLGLHELQEATVLPVWVEHVYNINPPVNPDGTYPLLHEKGYVGRVAKGLVGYDGNPSDLQVLGYLGYLLLAGWAWFNYEKVHRYLRVEPWF